MGLVKLTHGDIEKIQIDEGIVVINYGLSTQRIIGPTRGGATITITPSIRDIDHDGVEDDIDSFIDMDHDGEDDREEEFEMEFDNGDIWSD